MSLRTLLVDNYDSYTFNLYQLLAVVNQVPPTVIKNDEWSWSQLHQRILEHQFDNIVISPGPGTPSCPTDIGVCRPLLASDVDIPILGVCMGCQALGLAHGATISRAQPVHGKVSCVEHQGHRLFDGITSGSAFEVVRYHSLQVDEASLPDCLQPLAWTSGASHALHTLSLDKVQNASCAPACCDDVAASPEDSRILMALAHRTLPRYGVQFHPESIGTPLGSQLLQNFATLTRLHAGAYDGSMPLPGVAPAQHSQPRQHESKAPVHDAQQPPLHQAGPLQQPCAVSSAPAASSKPLDVVSRQLPGALASTGGSNDLFWSLFGQQDAHDTFWLDSASRDRGRFSYMGGRGGPLWRRYTYRLPPLPVQPPHSPSSDSLPPGSLEEIGSSGIHKQHNTHFLPWLDEMLHTWHALQPNAQPSSSRTCQDFNSHHMPAAHMAGSHSISDDTFLDITSAAEVAAAAADDTSRVHRDANGQGVSDDQQNPAKLPFDFWGGLVGYLGYELKAECGGRQAYTSSMPDAMLFLADRLIVIDHHTEDVYLLALVDASQAGSNQLAQTWLHGTHASIQQLQQALAKTQEAAAAASAADAALRSRSVMEASSAPTSAAAAESMTDGMQRTSSNSSTLSHMSSSHQGDQLQQGAKKGSTVSMQTYSSQPSDDSMALGGQQDTETTSTASDAGSEGHIPCQHDASHGKAHADGRLKASPQPGVQQLDSVGQAGAESKAAMPCFQLRRDRKQYMQDVATCLDALAAGESYEVCLTTALARRPAPDPRLLYPVLRALNPAPYAAWLSFGPQGPQICCSSPERFLKAGQDGWLEARPIKGTAKRHPDDPEADQAAAHALVTSEKDRAENLMIVDLMRNDLGRVCQVGSVHVPGLMDLESYATVHQLVSTVRGLRRPDASIADCLRATFPGGSMTGAPKTRTMEIIDRLEGGPRGVYSGSVGFIGFNNAFDLNIVIRTAVCHDGEVSIGAGGAIVVQSGVEEEYTEMRLKARALLAAVGTCDDPSHASPALVDDSVAYRKSS